MTIVQPNKEKNLRNITALCVTGVVLMLGIALFSYLSLVGLRHEISNTRESLEELKVANAELKNDYYALTSNDNLEQLASQLGLVKDKTPQWALASQH
ncbi:MAG: hypothetical protein NUV96_01190 [Candidatus Colwellbacteria bacterium]|nr:hypothetical protein [Candidatus Colwellbacteria bacterium]